MFYFDIAGNNSVFSENRKSIANKNELTSSIDQ